MEQNGNTNGNGQRKPRRKKSAQPFEVRDSPIHGRGAFANRKIEEGERIAEYVGQRMPWGDASEDPEDPHTFLFGLSDGDLVINAAIDGNDSRWINHSCDPNCEAVEERKRVFIYALRDIEPGEELFYDYGLQIDEPRSPETEKQFQCFCGASTCRGTLLEAEEKEEEIARK
jgi:SET domain-containing protein